MPNENINQRTDFGYPSALYRRNRRALGFRDEGLFDSALAQPYQSFSGSELYPTVEQKAARLCYGLVMNHAFIDGNKRIGTMAMLVFLAINGIELEHTQKELSDEILALASGSIG